jgi:hypothetical protein
MRRLIRLWIPVVLMLSMISCAENNQSPSDSSDYFDVAAFFNSESDRLRKSGYRLEKTFEWDGGAETKTLDTPDWKSELEPFEKSTLGKNPSMLYFADSVRNGDSWIIIYHAKDSATALRKMIVYGNTADPDSILIVRAVSNMYYKASDTLFYSGSGFSMNVTNDSRAGKDAGFRLEGKIITPN